MPARRVRRIAVAAVALCATAAAVRPARAQVQETAGVHVLDRVVAVVGNKPIMLSEALEEVNTRRQQGLQVPRDSAGQATLLRQVISDLIDIEVVLNVASSYKAEVKDDDVVRQVDDQYNKVRGQFKTEAEFREALKHDGFGTPEDYRRTVREQIKRYKLQQMGYDSLKAHGRLAAPVQVTEEEVSAAFASSKDKLPKRPEMVAFRQVVVAPRPSAAERAAARAKAESLLVEIQKGADFATVARRESMDPGSKDLGGDLGWARRGSGFVPEFERVIFSLPPGAVSPVFETTFGFHIVKIDRVQPAEVKSRHILIAPQIDSADVALARLRADTVLQKWKAGAPYDSLVAQYHDPAEEKSLLDGFAVDSLPPAYQTALHGVASQQFAGPFEIADPRTGRPKFGVIQVTDRRPGGEYTVADWKDRIRQQLTQEKQIRRMLDQLRREQYVRVMFDDKAPTAQPAARQP
ncbi:MAG: peptidylprolyl isomerase [Gemmatimonadaceae bacterium]|nr:peptidylprolyl isomerase [Gemmatimonadaceae bacterium]